MMDSNIKETSQYKEKRTRLSALGKLFGRLFKEKPLGAFGGVIVLTLILAGIFADILAPYGMNEIILEDTLIPPSANHLLGTDNVGRDLLSRIIYGARISMFVGLGGSALGIFLSTFIGLISGYSGGKTDMIIQRFVDAFQSIPPLVFYLSVMSIVGPGLIQVILVLGVHTGIVRSRIVRSTVISIKENAYIEAARAVGVSGSRIVLKHILPNIMAVVIVLFTTSSGIMILQEATLSFLGFGVPPPNPSWGGMLSGAGRKFMFDAPWVALFPGAALGIVIFGINMFGDAVRDLLDPRMRGGTGRYGRVGKPKKSNN